MTASDKRSRACRKLLVEDDHGHATVEQVGEVMVEPDSGMAMADYDIHSTVVVGDRPAVGPALYGYALADFPSIAWYVPQFNSIRMTPLRRHTAKA